MQRKIRISEFEKELKNIHEDIQIARSFDSDDYYYVRFKTLRANLCKFTPGKFDNFVAFSGNPFSWDLCNEVLNKVIEAIPHLVPDDYKEPTKEDLFEEFAKEAKDKGFHLTRLPPSPYKLEFNAQGQRWFVSEFDKDLKCFNVVPNREAPKDKYLEGLKLLLSYEEKVRALKPIKLYKIPLPGLTTTDWKQQYLSEKDGHYFASRKSGNLKQRWTGEELEEVPEIYREYAVEVEDEGC